MFFKLNPEIIFNINKNGTSGCFYDLMKKSKIEIPFNFLPLCSQLFNDEKSVDEIHDEFNQLLPQFTQFFGQHNLGTIYDKNVYIQRIKTILPFVLSNERMYNFKLPRLAIELTGKCNLNCCFCTSKNVIYRTCGCKQWNNEVRLSEKDYCSIIDQAILLGIKQVVFCGGEPLIELNLLKKLIIYINSKSHNINIRIQTNGTLLTQDIVKWFKQYNIHVLLQVLGDRDSIYKKCCSDGKAFEKITKALSYLKKFQIPVTIKILVNKLNEENISDIYNFYSKLFPKSIVQNYLFPPNKYVSDLYYSKSIDPHNFEYPVDIFNYQIFEKKNNCLFGQLLISCNGDVYPCMMIRDKLGDAKKSTLSEIIQEGKHLLY